MLRCLDATRSVALEEGWPDLLDAVYAPGSPLLKRDRELLESYERRDVDIERLHLNILEAKVVKAEPKRVRLDVTDQLSETRIRLRDGTARQLPRDRPTRRVIELVLTEEGWRIGSVSLPP